MTAKFKVGDRIIVTEEPKGITHGFRNLKGRRGLVTELVSERYFDTRVLIDGTFYSCGILARDLVLDHVYASSLMKALRDEK